MFCLRCKYIFSFLALSTTLTFFYVFVVQLQLIFLAQFLFPSSHHLHLSSLVFKKRKNTFFCVFICDVLFSYSLCPLFIFFPSCFPLLRKISSCFSICVIDLFMRGSPCYIFIYLVTIQPLERAVLDACEAEIGFAIQPFFLLFLSSQ